MTGESVDAQGQNTGNFVAAIPLAKDRLEMRVALYARVSTKEQTPENHLRDLHAYAAARGFEVVGEFTDIGVSGRKERRPALDEVIGLARARQVDALLVAAFDRFGRNLRHFLLTLDELAHLGVSLISLREQFDLLSPIGRLVASFLAGIAEFERALIVERIQAGLRRARAQSREGDVASSVSLLSGHAAG